MATSARTIRRVVSRPNFSLGGLFGSRTTFSHAAGKAAYAAGEKSGDTGLFDQWFAKSKWKNEPGLKGQLRGEYERGFEAEHARTVSRRGAAVPASVSEETRRTAAAPSTFKGYRVWQAGDVWKTSLDPESDFDSKQDAKNFIAAVAKRKYNPRRDVDAARVHEVLKFSPAIATLEKGMSYLNGRRVRRRNPEDAAAAKYEEFHGMPSGSIEVVEEDIHYHENLAELGELCKIVVHTQSRLEATFCFAGYSDKRNDFDPNTPSSDRPLLCTSEDGKQLYVIGGDQELDLAAIEMDGEEWIRDLMLIGEAQEITYQTKKGFDGFETVAYFHEIGEETGERPVLLYDSVNKLLSFAGGQYAVKPEDVGGGGSVYN